MSDVDRYAERARRAWAEANRVTWDELQVQWLSVADSWRALALHASRREADWRLAERRPAAGLVRPGSLTGLFEQTPTRHT